LRIKQKYPEVELSIIQLYDTWGLVGVLSNHRNKNVRAILEDSGIVVRLLEPTKLELEYDFEGIKNILRKIFYGSDMPSESQECQLEFDDLASEAFERLLNRLESCPRGMIFPGGASQFDKYLRTTITNIIARAQRKSNRWETVIEKYKQYVPEHEKFLDNAMRDELLEIITEVLSEKEENLFIMRVIEEKSFREIAKDMRYASADVVKTMFYRLRRKLKKNKRLNEYRRL
jgi:RNA polymerase sigma factor (sigma-70 family)